MLAGIEYRMMLDRRNDDVVSESCQTKDGEIVSLSPAAGEDHLSRPASQKLSDRLARALDRGPCLLSMMMNRRRVPEMLAKIRPHRLEDFRQYGRGGLLVEINPAHTHILRRGGIVGPTSPACHPEPRQRGAPALRAVEG